MFTLDNTEGFSEQDLDLLNQALEVLIARGWDEKNASDLVNNNFKVGGANTVESLTVTGRDFEKWIAWLDGQRDDAVEFDVPVGGTFDVAEAGAAALGIDVCEELNVARA